MSDKIKTIRTDSTNADFQALVRELDKDLSIRDGDEHAFYDQFNKIVNIKHVVLAYDGATPVGCGAVKEFAPGAVEVKRMFVPLEKRGNGIASIVLHELEKWTKEMGFEKCVLETGIKQPEAIALYKKNGYAIIPNFGQYIDIENSVCFEKML